MAMMDMIPLNDDSKKMVLGIMNAQYVDAVRLYARHFFKRKGDTAVALVDVDNEQLHIRCTLPNGKNDVLSMPYVDAKGDPIVVRSVGDCRKALVGMARIASEATGEHIDLPEQRNTDMPGGEASAEMLQMMQQMRQMMETAGSEQQQAQADGSPQQASSPGTVIQRGGSGNVVKDSLFKGEGSKLGGSSSAPPPPAPSNEPVSLREVDPEKPVVRLKVQLLDKRPAQVMVNKEFTLQDLRAWLQHHQGSSDAFHVMDVGGFPPKKLSVMTATIEDLGLTAATSLACRRA
eukprot:TRINITY_DN122658_c0_g1_i1.p1 TRINITY_DN122658_c0_g1~~TRINITY_DN122658_c0_g1_i1.p1  ORF type:complete len:322 (+),score=51.37 TRINITY_DN122658_c0_g1_i1:97-966(+)